MKLKGTVFFGIQALLFFACSCSRPSNPDSGVFNALWNELQTYSYADYDTLVRFYYRVDSVCSIQPSTLLRFLKKNIEARIDYREADYQRSNRDIDEAKTLLEGETGLDSLLAYCYNLKGVNYMNMGSYDSAFLYYNRSAVICDSIKDMERLKVVYSNMARAYYNKEEFDKAMLYIGKAVENTKSNRILLNALHLKANIYGTKGMIDSAMALDRAILSRYNTKENQYLITSFYNNLGRCFLEKNRIDSALYYCAESYRIDSLTGIKMNMASNLILLGNIHYSTGARSQALACFNRALTVFSDDGNADKRFLVFKVLADLAEKEANYTDLARYRDSMLVTYSKVNSVAVNKAITRLNIEFEAERKSHQISVQKKQLRIQRTALVLAVLSFVLMVVIVYFYLQNKNKVHRLHLAEQEQKMLSMLFEAEQNERSRIAGDLHDGVSQKLAVIQMHLSMMESPVNEEADRISGLLNEVVAEIRDISHNLYPKDLDKGIVQALESLCDQNNLMGKGMKFRLNADSSIARLRLGKSLELMVYRMAQELVNNAVKHSCAGEVKIGLFVQDTNLRLEVSDNGTGFDASLIEHSKGIGLSNIVNRMDQLGGSVRIHSGQTGTIVSITIPT